MLDIMGDQFIDFERQRNKDTYPHHKEPEEKGELPPHNEMNCRHRTSGRNIQTQDEKKDSDDGKNHEGEIDRMDHEFIGIDVLPAHSFKPFDETAHKTDRGGSGHHG